MATKPAASETPRKKIVAARLYCNDEEFDRLQAIAAMTGQSVPGWLRSVLRERLQEAFHSRDEKGDDNNEAGTPAPTR